MRLNLLIFTSICIACLVSCSKQSIIEIPLSQKNGYGYFHASLGGISPYSDDENNPWKPTYLKMSGIPEGWTDVKIGDIDINLYQSVYQNYILGNITQQRYEVLQKAWDWEPDTLELSKEPIRTKVAFVYGNDSTGQLKMIIDTNNNLDFSDDESFVPYERNPDNNINEDSIAFDRTIMISYQRFIDNKIKEVSVPIFITFMKRLNMLMANYPQYFTANFKGETIAICSDGFTNLSYINPSIALINDTLNVGDKINHENLISKNEFIEIKGNLYRNLGVDLNKNTLILEKMSLPKNKIFSTQIGFKPFDFEGNDFITQSNINLNELKGKYVLLDFWAVWCSPCLQELPNLKELYEKTDREKFEIIGIVGDSSSEALQEIIKNYSITWPQILSTESNKIKEDYSIHGYPTIFLVNPEGVIIEKHLRGRRLEERVLGLLNN